MAHPGFFDSIARDLSGPGIFGGKFQIRLFLQPIVAIALGLRSGIADAKAGRRPFIKELVLAEEHGARRKMLKEAVRDALVPLIIALLLDAILQHMINGRVRPLAALVVGGLLVFLPFLIMRALANRAWTHGHGAKHRPVSR
ncbi:MAG TPA: hypothetical protein VHK47_00650 [Polyangia bacterium]|jgi:hypothetical protein|nr:hypothetical protein [Polyangia bacterium]